MSEGRDALTLSSTQTHATKHSLPSGNGSATTPDAAVTNAAATASGSPCDVPSFSLSLITTCDDDCQGNESGSEEAGTEASKTGKSARTPSSLFPSLALSLASS